MTAREVDDQRNAERLQEEAPLLRLLEWKERYLSQAPTSYQVLWRHVEIPAIHARLCRIRARRARRWGWDHLGVLWDQRVTQYRAIVRDQLAACLAEDPDFAGVAK